MPRPTRIKYEDAFYHIMNRGKARQTIFHSEEYYLAFLATLEEAHDRFGAVFHAYCLMGNHYHLLVQTPFANIERIMRHISGVYTQRYNRLKKTDGPLFRGRYKAINVDADAYLLQVFRYITRNPIETKKPLASTLEKYPWSSYPAYLNKAECPNWLYRDKIYAQLGKRNKYLACARFVEEGIDEETKTFYAKGNIRTVIGDSAFKEEIIEEGEISKDADLMKVKAENTELIRIVETVAEVYNMPAKQLLTKPTGRRGKFLERKVAMYVCQLYGQAKLVEIASLFGLGNPGGVSNAISDVRKRLSDGELVEEINSIAKLVY